ncbi:MAG: hypothetical protein HFH57_04090 [Lachnospiraceae bacterium]|nr:hypothetical protein [Lachnospiraceae bacterium]
MEANAALADEKGAKFPAKSGALHLFGVLQFLVKKYKMVDGGDGYDNDKLKI